MTLNTISGDTTFRDGAVNMSGATSLTLPNACVGDAAVSAVTPLGTTKTRRRFLRSDRQANGASIATVTERLHVGYGATGSIIAARCMVTGVVGSGGGMSVTVDVKKNGTSILSAVMTINASTLLNTLVAGSINTAGFVAGDYFDVVVTATAGGGTLPQGLYVEMIVDEDPA